MFLFWILIIIGFIYFANDGELNNKFSSKSSNSYHNTKQRNPKDIVKERYAKGEINKDEYNEIMNNIKY